MTTGLEGLLSCNLIPHPDPDPESEDDDTMVTIKGKKLHYQTAVNKFCNQGRTNFGAKSRRKKFFGTAIDTCAEAHKPLCATSPEFCQDTIVKKGDTIRATFVPKKDSSDKSKKRKMTPTVGTVISMSVTTSASKNWKSNNKSNRKPASAVCLIVLSMMFQQDFGLKLMQEAFSTAKESYNLDLF